MEGDIIKMNTIYDFDWEAGRDPVTDRFRGKLEPTGLRPEISAQLAIAGWALRTELFSKLA
jgi:hypothetical protein